MKNPPIQKQHKIPEVYLKVFAIDPTKDQKKICVLIRGDKFTRKKNIRSFNVHENFFDIDSADPKIVRLYEGLNGLLETNYPKIIKELLENEALSIKYTSYLMQFAANLIGRSEKWRETVMILLKSDVKSFFIKHMIAHKLKPEKDEDIASSELFQKLNKLSPEDCINRIMLFLLVIY